jgi:endonuclease/exonuclease/phosphatase (EEP) superfamily protein YafD
MRLAILIILRSAAVVLCVFTLLPLLTTNEWYVRIFDFPRVQLIVTMVLTLAAFGIEAAIHARRAEQPDRSDRPRKPSRLRRIARVAPPVLLALAACWQGYRILPYTPLGTIQLQRSADPDAADTLRLLIFNVRYDNTDTGTLFGLIEKEDPDVILLVEPTDWWHAQLQPLEDRYPHAIRRPQENHYGILLYSRLELVDPQVRFLVEAEVPSIETGVRLRSGDVVTLYGLHPKPPGLKRPVDTERADTEQRDAELLTVAKEVRDRGELPVIVAGDFNDVAWSHTTRLFQRISGLLDPRVGRGLYNSYHAQSLIARFPLDHVFVSDHFRLVEMRVLPPAGSDHHPVLITLSFEPEDPETKPEPSPEPGDLEEAEEAIEDGLTPNDD